MDAAVEVVALAKPHRGRMALFVLLLVLANLVWGGQLSAGKYIGPHLGPFAIAFLPFFFITPLLLPLLIRNRIKHPDAVRPNGGDWMRFVVAGVGGQLVAQLGMNWGPIKGEASSCGILYLLVPVFTAVLASMLLRERVTPLRIMCLAIGLAGALFMSWKDLHGGGFLKSGFLVGNLLMLVGCLGASFYNVYCKGLMTKFHERDILIYSYITATPASLPILLYMEPDCFSRLMHMHDWHAWVAFAFLVIFVYGISMLMLFYVLQFLPVTVVLASTYLVPVFAVALGVLLWNEKPNVYTLVGGLIVLASTVLIMKYDAGAPEEPAPK